MSKVVVYSLTGRGLYSELLNLVLAKAYCDFNNYQFVINTRFWNSKGTVGWLEYFRPTINSTNNIFSAQIFFDGSKHKLSLRGIYRNPVYEFLNIPQSLMNWSYKITTKHLLSEDIVGEMRDPIFIEQIGNAYFWQSKFHKILEEIYVFNDSVKSEINSLKATIGVYGIDYIGIHIRRGDKIKSKEMNLITLEQYSEAILLQRHISSNVYIATDDIAIVEEMKKLLGSSFNVFSNTNMVTVGFDESKFNKKNKQQRIWETKLALLDVDILKDSSFFIGTYSSNLSRIIPVLKKFKNCKSIDIDWNPVF